MKKRTKIIILSVMVVLLGVTGYLNVALNNSVKDVPTQTSTASYFASYRQDREARRDQELLYYQAIAESPTSTDEAVKSANDARMALIAQMDTELMVEGLIKGLGFNDCVITLSNSNINVLVEAQTLTDNEVAQIVDMLIEQKLATDIDFIKIIPVD